MHHILLIEDTREVRLILQAGLEEAGHRVSVAGTCQDARRVLTDDAVDLVVVDVLLPDGSGMALADEVAESAIPVVVMTGDIETMVGMKQTGRQCLRKPFPVDDLLALVQSFLGS